MYRKSIKAIMMVISFVAILLIANSSFAVVSRSDSDAPSSPVFGNGMHIDPWSGLEELLPQNINRETAAGGTFCMQKHQALRYTPAGVAEADGFTSDVYAHSELHSYGSSDVPSQYARETVISNVENQLIDKLTDLGCGIAEPGSGLLFRYGISDYEYNEITPSGSIVAVSQPYSKTPKYVSEGKQTFTNDYLAYILSSGEYFNPITRFGLKKGNYKGSVSDTASGRDNGLLIQDAVWSSAFNRPASDGVNYRRTIPQVAVDLVKEAEEYEKFVPELTNYSAEFEKTDPKVIANRENNTYSVGPLKITYPKDRRFSYIQDIYLVDEGGNKIDTQSFRVITISGEVYPESGEEFFVEFDGSVGESHDKINVKAEFAYLQLTQAEIETFKGSGEISQIVGKLTSSSDTHEYKEAVGSTHYYCNREHIVGKLEETKIGRYTSQALFNVLSVRRDWVEDEAKTYAEKDKLIDLRTELGGFVWVDEIGGKESSSNNVYDKTEKIVPNITVKLYQENGKFIKETVTNEEGKYTFKDLNALKKYYVTFLYNGLYYEPIEYTSPDDKTNGWGRGTWKNNSNSTDVISEREQFNEKFGSIGSSPKNYEVNGESRKTFTKQELLDAKVIDEFGNLISKQNGEMEKFVKDCLMTAHTGLDTKYDKYPTPDIYLIDNEVRVKNSYGRMYNMAKVAGKVVIVFPDAYYINLGLQLRPEADLALKKDIQKVDVEINGHKQSYTYNTLENKPNADETWEIGVRISDQYYSTNYSRELYKSDYLYKVSKYGDAEKLKELGKSKDDELNVYVTYKIMVRNQSFGIKTRVDEIVDYYDPDYELAPERSYIEVSGGKYQIGLNTESIYGAETQTQIDGYDRIYITGIGKTGANSVFNDGKSDQNGIYLKGGEIAYFYLTFKVKKDRIGEEDWLKLDENLATGEVGIGKENIAEINGYSTMYGDGTQIPNAGDVTGKVAGILDEDSTPGNLNPNDVPKDGIVKYENFEDDTDKAPNIRIVLFKEDEANRVVKGSVWEDERVTDESKEYSVADGIINENIPINGVTVELVEIMNNGSEFTWRTTESGPNTNTKPIIDAQGMSLVSDYDLGDDKDGVYVFKSFVPGKYVVRFTYGDTIKTIAPASLGIGGLNAKSYNGQDYKSTTYQKDTIQNNTYDWRLKSTYMYGQEILGDLLTTVPTFKEDASNNERVQLPKISEPAWTPIDANAQQGYLYDFTESQKVTNNSSAKDIESWRNVVNNYSNNNGNGVRNYLAEVLASHKADYATMNDRAKLLDDLAKNTKMRAETGLMVFEVELARTETENQEKENKTSYQVQNVNLGLEERPKAQILLSKDVSHIKVTLANGSILFDTNGPTKNVLWKNNKGYEYGYIGGKLDPSKFGTLEDIRNNIAKNAGLVQITMDEELMHGATIKIDYKITAKNIGEVDYKDNIFYYTGKIYDKSRVATTTVNKVIDYVSNNIKFNADSNSMWKSISKDELKNQGLVNARLIDDGATSDFNTIIITDALKDEKLVPEKYKEAVNDSAKTSASAMLTLTQLVTSENDSKDLTFTNMAEIVETNNTVGRRMEYSVVGNQNPTFEVQELDTAASEIVRILPPFGNAGIYIAISLIIIASAGIVITGVYFIKKRVLTK